MHRPQHVSTRHYSPRSQATGLLELQCCLLVHQRSSRGSKTLAFFGEYGSLLLLPQTSFFHSCSCSRSRSNSCSLPHCPHPIPFLTLCFMYVCMRSHMPTMERASITTLFYLLWNKKKMGAHQSPGRNLLCQGGCKAPIVGWMYPSLICLALHTHPHTLICV